MTRTTAIGAFIALALALAIAGASAVGVWAAGTGPPGAPAPRAADPAPSQSLRQAQGESYGCPMHPDVRSAAPGTCPICGMDLMPMGPPGGRPYRVELTTIPSVLRPGATAGLRFRLKHPVTGAPVTDLQIVHEKPFHLFIVSDDLEDYQHIHPVLADDGAFVVDAEVPRAGRYHVYCDFLPVGGTPQVIHEILDTAGDRPVRGAKPARHRIDATLEKVVDGIRFRLTLEPSAPAAGMPAAFLYHLEDAATGRPVGDLEPYLGAWGHTLVLAEDATDFVHSHPTRLLPAGAAREAMKGGPDVAFNAKMTKPGVHRLWSQFQRGGRVTTVSFTIEVWPIARLAVWDGRRWSSGDDGSLGDLDGEVRAIAVRGRDLFAGGTFTRAGGAAASRIARWDGRTWSPLGAGVNGTVRAIAAVGGSVYVGGDFTEAGGAPANHLARWDGRRWWALGEGLSGCGDAFCAPTVNAIVAGAGGAIFAGGRFTRAGETEAHGIARWDGRSWSALAGGVRTGAYDGEVLALAFGGGALYAGGRFATAGDVPARSVARWDGARWTALGGGIAGGLEKVAALGLADGVLYAGGDFTRAGEHDVDRAARWDGKDWSPLGPRTREPVETIAVDGASRSNRATRRTRTGAGGGRVVVVGGGTFTLADGTATKGVVRGDGPSWSALGPGIAGGTFLAPVQALAADASRVWVGGGPFIVASPREPVRNATGPGRQGVASP